MPEEMSVPEFAQLRNGMTPEDLREAISRSGYPFQATTAAALRSGLSRHFHNVKIQEEWEYIDSETQQSRSVDIFVDFSPTVSDSRLREESHVPLFSRINLVVECKQSDNPYIFFLRESAQEGSPSFPEMFGPLGDEIKIFDRERGEISNYGNMIDIRQVLGFYEFDFMLPALPYAISLAKVQRNKSKLEVTGEETYRALTYPLLKAVDHLRGMIESRTRSQMQEHFIVPIAIVRAPMIGSFLSGGGEQKLISLPWVRVSRLEPARDPLGRGRKENPVRYYDVVHESYVSTYIDTLAEAFKEIGERIMVNSGPLRLGMGSSESTTRPYASLECLPEGFKESDDGFTRYISVEYGGVSFEEEEDDGPELVEGANHVGWIFPRLHDKGQEFVIDDSDAEASEG